MTAHLPPAAAERAAPIEGHPASHSGAGSFEAEEESDCKTNELFPCDNNRGT